MHIIRHYSTTVCISTKVNLVLSSLCNNCQYNTLVKENLEMLTFVDISLGVVGSFVDLVRDGILSGRGTRGQACVRVLGDRLVGLLGCLSTGALDSLRDVVGGVLW